MLSAIPDQAEDITADWLSESLGEEVLDCQLVASHSGTTGRARITLETSADSALPPTLFVKLPPRDPVQREFVCSSGMGWREARFYRELGGEVPVRVPRCYFADWDDSGRHYIILLEDLDDTGCTFRNATRDYSLDYVRAMLQSFAHLHARYWKSERFGLDLNWVQPPLQHEIAPRLVALARDQHAASMPPVFSELCELYLNHTDAVHQLWLIGSETLIHGDVHDGNLFRDGVAPGFLDWALLARGPAMRDVSYFLAGTLPEEHRPMQRDLINEYREQLEGQGVEAPSLDELWLQHRCQVFYPWVGAVTTLAMGDQWQPLSYVQATLTRLHAVVAALDTAGVVRELIAATR